MAPFVEEDLGCVGNICMPPVANLCYHLCARSVGGQHAARRTGHILRHYFRSTKLPLAANNVLRSGKNDEEAEKQEKGNGAMSRLLLEMSERSLEGGGRSAQKVLEEAGFDKELKEKLQERISSTNFRNEFPSAFSQMDMPSTAGKGTRDIAAARPWTGTEALEDSVLRMLSDTYKPMRSPAKLPSIRGPPPKVDTGRPKRATSLGARLANARDRSSKYSYLKDESLSEKERDQFRKELKERFTPGARLMPTTLQGLSSLANERIEDAIARGQFKNLPRGKELARDYNMSSPFLDTTEYFMNKIIQKQDIVPPWIEKQQEVVSTATKFRGRLRQDWRRHAARLIGSSGGSLQAQLQRAKDYAAAEAIVNPPKRKEEIDSILDDHGDLSKVVIGSVLVPSEANNFDDQATDIAVISKAASKAREIQELEGATVDISMSGEASPPLLNLESKSTPDTSKTRSQPTVSQLTNSRISGGASLPFRDPKWEDAERSYHVAAIKDLNSMTRSYNLMAPRLAQKPYFSLDRELRSCFADVAPQLAEEIQYRATAPKAKVEVIGHRAGSVLERLAGEQAKVYDERKPQYGFKEFWKDLFGAKEST